MTDDRFAAHANDFSYFMARLAGRQDDAGLLANFNQLPEPDDHTRIWAGFIRGIAPLLAHGQPAWPSERILLQAGLEQHHDSVVGAAARAWLRDHAIDWTIARRASPVDIPGAELVSIIGARAPVRGAAWLAPDRIISWSDDAVQIADPATGLTTETWRHDDVVVVTRPLPDGRIASCGYDGVLVIHDRQSHLDERIAIGDREPVMDLVPWCDHGLIIADITGQLYRWRNGEPAAIALDMMVDPDTLWNHRAYLVIGDDLVRYGANDLIVQSLVHDGHAIRLTGHADSIHGILELADHRRVLSWSEDRTLRIWNLRDRATAAVLAGHDAYVAGAAPRPSGGALSWSADGTVRTWTADGRLERVLEHDARPRLARALWGDAVVTLADDGVRLWRTSAHARFWALAQPTGIEPLSGERLAVIAARDPTIHVVDASRDASRTEMMRVTGHAGPVHGLAGSPGGGRLLSWSADGSVRTWRSDWLGAHDGECVPRGRVERAVVLDGDRLLTGHALGHIVLTSTSPREECWSAVEPGLDGLAVAADVVAAWSHDRVCIRHLADGSVAAVRNVEPLGPTVPGRHVLALSRSRLADVRDAAVWRMDTGELVATLAAPGGHWAGAAWLPDGDAVLWSEAGELFRWVRTSARLAAVPLGGRAVLDVIPVGARIAIITSEGSLLVALSTLAEPPVVFADHIEGAMALSDSRLVCWTSAGDIYISSAQCDSVERAVPGRGHRLAWTARTPTGMVAIEDGGVARYVSRSTTASVHDIPVYPDCVMVSADESMLAVSRNNGVDILRLPSLGAIARWQADGHVRIHGVTRDHRFMISTPDGSVDVLEVGPAR